MVTFHNVTSCLFFFLNAPAPTEIYPLPLHDALPISEQTPRPPGGATRSAAEDTSISVRFASRQCPRVVGGARPRQRGAGNLRRQQPSSHQQLRRDRKSTRLNSSHSQISYAVFCLKKK